MRDRIRAFRREPMRFVLTLLGVVVGAASVVFLAAVLHGANYALAYASQSATGSDVTRVEERRPPPGTKGTPPGLSARDARALAQRQGVPESAVVPASTLYNREAAAFGRMKKVGVQSGGAAYGTLAGLSLRAGRWPTAGEEGERLCVIGSDIWEDLFQSQWPVTAPVVLDHATRLTVIGVLEPKPPIGGGDGDGTWRVDRQLFVTNELFSRDIAPIDTFDEISFRHATPGAEPRSPKEVAGELMPVLLNLHRGVKNFEFDALSRDAELDTLITLALGLILVGCGAVATIVGAVNVMNAQLVSVQEKTREYGIRRALGVSARRLAQEVVIETLGLTLAGSVVGVVLGLSGAYGLSSAMTRWVTPWPFEIVPWALAAALGNGVLAGLVAAYLPARRASQLPVVDCLRAV